MCVWGGGGGKLTSDSKWGSENTFCQGPAFTSVSFESKILDFVKFVYLNLKVNYSSRMRGIKKGEIL